MTFVVDTHALIWLFERNPRLSADARREPVNPDATLIIPAIVLAEIWDLFHRKKLASRFDQVRAGVLASVNCKLYPFDEAVLALMAVGLEIHDAIVVATTILHRDRLGPPVRLITADDAIRRSGLVDVHW